MRRVSLVVDIVRLHRVGDVEQDGARAAYLYGLDVDLVPVIVQRAGAALERIVVHLAHVVVVVGALYPDVAYSQMMKMHAHTHG